MLKIMKSGRFKSYLTDRDNLILQERNFYE